MPVYQIHRLKDHLRQPFRFAPHVSGTALVKPRDYELADTVEAATPYAAYFERKDSPDPLVPGDLLEVRDNNDEAPGHAGGPGKLCIFKFVGFEDAQWVLPDPAPLEAGVTTPQETALR